MRVVSLLVGLALGAGLAPGAALAKSKWKSKGQVTLEGRVFSNDNDPLTVDQGLGLLTRLELRHKHRPFQERARIFARVDSQDFDRTVVIVEELWAEVDLGDLEIRAGIDLLNWTATEAFHPADIVNARNLDSDVENYEKIGEPMVAVSYGIGVGSLTAYFFPYYTEPKFPAQSSRLSFIPPSVEVGPFLRMNANGDLTGDEFGPQGALRFTQTIGKADIGVHVVHHLDRSQPEVLFDPDLNVPRPLFRTVTQVGGTYQQVLDAFILKVEAGYRFFSAPEDNVTPLGPVQERDHLQVAVGLEYNVLVGQGEVTFLAEGQSYFGVPEEIRQTLGIFQRDVLFGARFNLNDMAGTQALVSAIIDLEDASQVLLNASVTRRILSSWDASLAFRMVFDERPPDAIQGGFTVPRESDHVRLFITRYF